MGVVYEVRHVETDRRYALKALPLGKSSDDKVVARFLREAETAQRLDHPNIIKIHEVGREGQQYWFVMDLIEGKNLEEIINKLRKDNREFHVLLSSVHGTQWMEERREGRGRVDHQDENYIRTMTRLIVEVAGAVHYSHGEGIIHRDIKPSNLILSKDGRLMLTDFGLVRDIKGKTFTVMGEVLGTPLYMSPEQIVAKRKNIDARTDTYSLGATLYEVLTMQPQFMGDDLPSLVKQIQYDTPVAVTRHNDSVPEPLDVIVSKAMEKRAGSRYESTSAMAADLQRWLDGKNIVAKAPGPLTRLWRKALMHPEQSIAITAAVLVVLVVLGFSVFREVGQTQRKRSEVADYLRTANDLFARESWSSAWNAAEGALSKEDDNVEASELKGRILTTVAARARAEAGREGDGVDEAFRLTMVLMSLAPDAEDTRRVRDEVREALEATVTREATRGRYEQADQRLVLVRRLTDGSGRLAAFNNELALALVRAAAGSAGAFSYAAAAAHVNKARELDAAVKLPPAVAAGHERWVTQPYVQLERVAISVREGDTQARAQAIKDLGTARSWSQLPSAEATRLLRETLAAESDSSLVAVAVKACGDLRLAAAVPELIAAAGRVPSVEALLISALGSIRGPEGTDYLLSALDRVDDSVARQTIVQALARHGSPEVERVLTGMLADDQTDVAIASAWALGRIGASAAAIPMFVLAEKVSDPGKRTVVLDALGRLDAPVNLDRLRALYDAAGDTIEKIACVRIAAYTRTAGSLEFLKSVLTGVADERLRGEAATALGALRMPEVASVLGGVLQNTRQPTKVRALCAFALGEMAGTAPHLYLLENLERGGGIVRQSAALALGNFEHAGDDDLSRTIATLFNAFQRARDDDVRAAAVSALGRLGAHHLASFFVKVVKDFEPVLGGIMKRLVLGSQKSKTNVLNELFETYGPVGALLPGSTALLGDENRVVTACCGALGRLAPNDEWKGPQRGAAVTALVDLLAIDNVPAQLRRAAFDALGRFKGDLDPQVLAPMLRREADAAVESAGNLAMARLGGTKEAHRYFAAVSEPSGETCYDHACVFGLEGDLEGALEWLTKATLFGFSDAEQVRGERDLAMLISDPRAARLLAGMTSP